MFSQEQIAATRRRVFDLVHFSFEKDIAVSASPGLRVELDGQGARIAAESLPALARGFFRLAQEVSAGKSAFSLREEKRFDSCGCFLDMSRNGVMTVSACKRYMDYSAALGLNTIVLYTEDTYTVPEYPYMGYLRGRYTPEELRELDAYAAELGIELVPCIQTLAHLGQFLQWKPNESLKDQPTCLLVDEPDTYAFIEAEIRAIRACVSGSRLHIGMDEAHGVGLGAYYAKHGPCDRFALLNRHLERVEALCRKYGFRPMMWSDMFFRLGSKSNEYYDKEANIPPSVIAALPDVDLCYWDYYHTDESWYEHMLTQHEKMGPNTLFAGGIWTWSGFLPQVELTYRTMEPGLRCCARHHVKTVLATMWGDDGAETDCFLALSQVPIFSEFCWRGEACDREAVVSTAEFLTGLPRQAYAAFGLFYPGEKDRRVGKALIYCDLLYPLGPDEATLREMLPRFEQARAQLSCAMERADCRYADALFDICIQKARLLLELRPRYLAGDRDWLRAAVQESIPRLAEAYARLRDLHAAQWEATRKRNGWEVMALRYGAVLGRLEDVRRAIARYADGELNELCELEETPLPNARKGGMQFYSVYVSPVYSL